MKIINNNKLPFIKEKTILSIDWKNVPTGTPFKGQFYKKDIEGKIFNNLNDSYNPYIYFCQDSTEGSDSPNPLGYEHGISYSPGNIRNGADTYLDDSNIVSIELFPLEEGYVVPITLPIMAEYRPKVRKGFVKFGCQQVPNEHIRLLAENLID